PTAPRWIFFRLTDRDLRSWLPTACLAIFRLVTEASRSWLVPTLPAGSWVAAQPTPPSATNSATNASTMGADGRRRNRRFTFIAHLPVSDCASAVRHHGVGAVQ